MTVEVFDPPVRLRCPTPARTMQLLLFAFGLTAGFLAGVGFVLVAGSLDTSAPALRCALHVEH